MDSAPALEFPGLQRRKAVIRHVAIWLGLALLAVASIRVRSTPICMVTSACALACAISLHFLRRDAAHAFIFGQVILAGGSAIVLLTCIATSDPVFPVVRAMLESFTERFFARMGTFVFLYAILWGIVMTIILASQRDR